MNLKLKKKLNVLLTVVMVLCVALCFIVCMQVITGKEVSICGFRIYNILTGSMEPTIPTGTSILVHETDPYKLEVGDIITFASTDAAIYGQANTHRIIEVLTDENGNLCFRTKGDANSAEDLQLVYPENIKGKVVFHLNASVANFLSFMHTPMGFASVILLPMAFIVGLVTRDFKKSVKEYMKEIKKEELAKAQAAAEAEETTAPLASPSGGGAGEAGGEGDAVEEAEDPV